MSLCVRTSMANSPSCIILMHKMLTNVRGYMWRLWDTDHHVKMAEKRLYFKCFLPPSGKKKNTEPSNVELTDRKTFFMPENSKLCHPTSYVFTYCKPLNSNSTYALISFVMFNYYHHFKRVSFH